MAMREWRRRKPSEVVREHHHTETRAETVSKEVLERLSALERRDMEHEHALQIILQSLEQSIIRVTGIETAICSLSDEAEQLYTKAG